MSEAQPSVYDSAQPSEKTTPLKVRSAGIGNQLRSVYQMRFASSLYSDCRAIGCCGCRSITYFRKMTLPLPPLYLIRNDRGLEKITDLERVFEIEVKDINQLQGFAFDSSEQLWRCALVPQPTAKTFLNFIDKLVAPKSFRDRWTFVQAKWTLAGEYTFPEFKQAVLACLKDSRVPVLIFADARIIARDVAKTDSFEKLIQALHTHIFEADEALLPFNSTFVDQGIDLSVVPTTTPNNHADFVETVNALEGKSIQKVCYYPVNYPERSCTFDGFHLTDVAITLEFHDGSILNWLWQEDLPNDVSGYGINTENIREELLAFDAQEVDLTTHPDWQRLVGVPLNMPEYRTRKDPVGIIHLTDFTLSYGRHAVTFCATEEPDPEEISQLNKLPIAQEWTVIVFDETLLKKLQRGPHAKV